MNWIKEHWLLSALIIFLAAVLIWYFFFNTKFKIFSKGGKI